MMTRTWLRSAARHGVHRLLLTVAALAIAGVGVHGQIGAPTDDPTVNGFAVEDAAIRGRDVHFKIETDAQAFSIAIYRFSGDGSDVLMAALPNPPAPQVQPPCVTDPLTRAIDCSNWSESASWTVPADAAPGTYYALLRREDTGGVNHILFVVQ